MPPMHFRPVSMCTVAAENDHRAHWGTCKLNDRLLLNESRELAFHGERMLKEGRLADAEKLALSILPKDLGNPDRPYSFDAERLLRNCHMSRNLSFCMIEPEGSVISVDYKMKCGALCV